jgi:hypothetical protein
VESLLLCATPFDPESFSLPIQTGRLRHQRFCLSIDRSLGDAKCTKGVDKRKIKKEKVKCKKGKRKEEKEKAKRKNGNLIQSGTSEVLHRHTRD